MRVSIFSTFFFQKLRIYLLIPKKSFIPSCWIVMPNTNWKRMLPLSTGVKRFVILSIFHCIFYRALTIYQCFNSPSLFLFPTLENSRGLEKTQYFLVTFQSNHISQIHCFLILEDGIQVIH